MFEPRFHAGIYTWHFQPHINPVWTSYKVATKSFHVIQGPLNTFRLVACFLHEIPTGLYFMTFAAGLSHYPGGLSPPREDYHLYLCRFRTVTPICREKWPAVHIWSTSSLTPFPHNNSGLVYLLLSKGLWVKSIKASFLCKKTCFFTS